MLLSRRSPLTNDNPPLDELLKRYRAALEKAYARGGRKEAHTDSGIPLETLHTPLDLPNWDYAQKLGLPGEPPFTRGVQPTMYRGRPWTMRQYAGFGDAKESNARYRYLLEQGQTGLSVAFDLPTQMGFDSDGPLAEGEVGKVGVAVDTLEDMEVLFGGIPLDKVSTSMTINATAFILLALYQTVAEAQGASAESLTGTVQNDILKEYVARGTYIYPPKPSLRITTDLFEYATASLPKFNTISISGYHIREAGSTAAQEIAFTLLDGLTYVQAAVDQGLDVDAFGERLSFFFNAHSNFLEEVAKYRAARRLWGRFMRDRFGAKNPKACMLRFHTQTAGSTLTAQQPLVNIVRTALEAFAAAMGGTQSLHTNSYDEALGLPTQDAATVALRTQQVIAFESGACDTVDPLAGSYAIEYLTDALETKALEIMAEVEKRGGVVAAIEAGYIQGEIQEAAYTFQLAVEKGGKVIVGVNRFQEGAEAPIPILKVNPEMERCQVERLRAVRARRAPGPFEDAMRALDASARDGSNLMGPTLSAVRAFASVGEIADALRNVFGVYHATKV
jgi:methylmalonyl-CoA mutase N-terminal domain/subunit